MNLNANVGTQVIFLGIRSNIGLQASTGSHDLDCDFSKSQSQTEMLLVIISPLVSSCLLI